LQAAWPNFWTGLTVDASGKFHLKTSVNANNLAPLQGMKLTTLFVASGKVRDLAPLSGMQLKSLVVGYSYYCTPDVRDLMPLEKMPLESLTLLCPNLEDLTPLRGLSQLKSLGLSCPKIRDLAPLRGLPLTSLSISGHRVRDLTPLQETKKLTRLALHWYQADLTRLTGMQLTSLTLYQCPKITDLTPLKDMPLTKLTFGIGTRVRDLTPLGGLQLQELAFHPNFITKGMEAIRKMTSLTTIAGYPQPPMPAAEFWARYDDGEFRK